MVDVAVPNEAFQTEDLTVESALKQVFATCKNHNKLALGAIEVVKALYRGAGSADSVKLVVMAKDLLQSYQDIIIDQCRQQGIVVMYVEDRKQLGAITPLKKVKNTGVIGIKDFVCESREKAFVVNACKN